MLNLAALGRTQWCQSRQWADNEGNRRHTTEIVIHDMKMLEPKQSVEAPFPSPAEEATPF